MSVNQGGTFLANFPRNYFLNSCLSKNVLKVHDHEDMLKTAFYQISTDLEHRKNVYPMTGGFDNESFGNES